MRGVYRVYPYDQDYMRLLDTMLPVLRDAQAVANRRTLANDLNRGSSQKFAADCIRVTMDIANSLNELYLENKSDARVSLVHLPGEGWTVKFIERKNG